MRSLLGGYSLHVQLIIWLSKHAWFYPRVLLRRLFKQTIVQNETGWINASVSIPHTKEQIEVYNALLDSFFVADSDFISRILVYQPAKTYYWKSATTESNNRVDYYARSIRRRLFF